MIIYLVRHGETDWNRQGRLQGQADVELNDNGRKQAAAIREKLGNVRLDAACSSDLKRAKETMRIILNGRKVPVWEDPRLREMDFGRGEGGLIREIKADEKNPLYGLFEYPGRYIPPETVESFEHLYRRTGEFMKERLLPLEKQYENLLVVGHGAVNRSILNPLMGVGQDHFWEKKMKNCAVAKIALEDGRLRLLEYDPGI